jgi:hypothetical protein
MVAQDRPARVNRPLGTGVGRPAGLPTRHVQSGREDRPGLTVLGQNLLNSPRYANVLAQIRRD